MKYRLYTGNSHARSSREDRRRTELRTFPYRCRSFYYDMMGWDEVNLVFINGISANLVSTIEGGERVVLYPPLGGG